MIKLVPIDEKEIGVSPVIIISIVAFFLFLLGGSLWLFSRPEVVPTTRVMNIFAVEEPVVVKENPMKFDLPDLDVTGPDLPPLGFADMEFSAPAPSGDGLMESFTVDSDFSLTANIAVAVPPVSFEVSVRADSE